MRSARCFAEFTLSSQSEILRSAQDDKRRAQHDGSSVSSGNLPGRASIIRQHTADRPSLRTAFHGDFCYIEPMQSSRVRMVVVLVAVWAGLILLHYPWRCLPYYWDEAGYYALAALDFYRQALLIPESTQKLGHTPLVPAVIGAAWRVLGLSPCGAREAMMLVAAATLVATYALGRRVAGRKVAAWAAALLAVSPLFFAQSSMLHIEIAPALFITLAILALLPRPELSTRDDPGPRMAAFALAASLAILSKETSVILLPVAWAYAWRARRELPLTAPNTWVALGFPLVPLIAWAI